RESGLILPRHLRFLTLPVFVRHEREERNEVMEKIKEIVKQEEEEGKRREWRWMAHSKGYLRKMNYLVERVTSADEISETERWKQMGELMRKILRISAELHPLAEYGLKVEYFTLATGIREQIEKLIATPSSSPSPQTLRLARLYFMFALTHSGFS